MATATQGLQMEGEEKHRAPDFVHKLPAAEEQGLLWNDSFRFLHCARLHNEDAHF